MAAFVQNILNGLALGGVYALVALGYTMVYGVLQFINFAHSEIFMMGAFAALFIISALKLGSASYLSFFIAIFGAALFCSVLGIAVEKIAYRPLRKAPRLNVLITAIGVSLFLQNLGIVIFGADPKVFPSLIETQALFDSSSIIITNVQVIVIVVSACLMLLLNYLVHFTKMGIAMRAVSFDIQVASLMGISIDHIITFTFLIGSSLAGSAAVLYGLSYPRIEPLMGLVIGLKAFVAAVFGGVGNIFGAAFGGIFIGLAESMVVYYVSSSYRDALAFAILIIVLLFKPAGLFGIAHKEKV